MSGLQREGLKSAREARAPVTEESGRRDWCIPNVRLFENFPGVSIKNGLMFQKGKQQV